MILELDVDDVLEIFPDARKEGIVEAKRIRGISSLNRAVEGDLSFLGNPSTGPKSRIVLHR